MVCHEMKSNPKKKKKRIKYEMKSNPKKKKKRIKYNFSELEDQIEVMMIL
jgi:hypothetical protein